jgi:hypothetical protein
MKKLIKVEITDEKIIFEKENQIKEFCINDVLKRCVIEIMNSSKKYDIYDFISDELRKNNQNYEKNN